jgi:hypothetical protein
VLLLALCLAGIALTPRAAKAGPGTYTNPISATSPTPSPTRP